MGDNPYLDYLHLPSKWVREFDSFKRWRETNAANALHEFCMRVLKAPCEVSHSMSGPDHLREYRALVRWPTGPEKIEGHGVAHTKKDAERFAYEDLANQIQVKLDSFDAATTRSVSRRHDTETADQPLSRHRDPVRDALQPPPQQHVGYGTPPLAPASVPRAVAGVGAAAAGSAPASVAAPMLAPGLPVAGSTPISSPATDAFGGRLTPQSPFVVALLTCEPTELPQRLASVARQMNVPLADEHLWLGDRHQVKLSWGPFQGVREHADDVRAMQLAAEDVKQMMREYLTRPNPDQAEVVVLRTVRLNDGGAYEAEVVGKTTALVDYGGAPIAVRAIAYAQTAADAVEKARMRVRQDLALLMS